MAKTYTRTKHMAAYWAVDRAIEHWDGPVNFREDFQRSGRCGLPSGASHR